MLNVYLYIYLKKISRLSYEKRKEIIVKPVDTVDTNEMMAKFTFIA